MFMSQTFSACISPCGVSVCKDDTRKVVSLENFLGCLKTTSPVETPLLPLNCRNFIRVGRTTVITLEFLPSTYEVFHYGKYSYVPKDYRDEYIKTYEKDNGEKFSDYARSRYYGLIRYKIPTPHLLYTAVLAKADNNNYFVRGDYLYALTEGFRSLKQDLYRCPFGNVGSEGKFCWGDAERARGFSSLISLGSAMNVFFSGSVFNNDLDSSSKFYTDEIHGESTIDLFRALHMQEEFPTHILRIDTSVGDYGYFINDHIMHAYT